MAAKYDWKYLNEWKEVYNLKCEKCKYRMKIDSGHTACGYILVTKERRGCKPDENCNKYEKGASLISKNRSTKFRG